MSRAIASRATITESTMLLPPNRFAALSALPFCTVRMPIKSANAARPRATPVIQVIVREIRPVAKVEPSRMALIMLIASEIPAHAVVRLVDGGVGGGVELR